MVSGKKKDITKPKKANGTKPDKKCTFNLSVNNPMYGIRDAKIFPTTVQKPVTEARTVEGKSSTVYG